MKILSITAQKPNSTGSGVYLTELVRALAARGHQQAILAGVTAGEAVSLPEGIPCYRVDFGGTALPFPVVGMSDSMPYPSTRYRDLTPAMTAQLHAAFLRVAREAVAAFEPDVLICHHLYGLAALLREEFPTHTIVGICHGTDLRQFQKTDWERERIARSIPKLDGIFALHGAQRIEIARQFGIPVTQIEVLGSGYNSDVFYPRHLPKAEPIRIIFAGKLCRKKGVVSLLRGLEGMSCDRPFEVYLAGGYSDPAEYAEIVALSQAASYPCTLLGMLRQEELADWFNRCHIMVLPSFFEGLPLVILEALATGLAVVSTELPGIRPWLEENIPQHGVTFLTPPPMQQVDEATDEDLWKFEQEIGAKMAAVISGIEQHTPADLTAATWAALGERLERFLITAKKR